MTDDRRQIRQPLSIVWEFRLHLASGSAAGAGSWGHSLKIQSVRKNTFLQIWLLIHLLMAASWAW